MAKSVLNLLVTKLGADFDMSGFNNDTVNEKWMDVRKAEVAMTTVKKELSWINGFSAFAFNQKYCLVPLTLVISKNDAQNVHRAYFDSNC